MEVIITGCTTSKSEEKLLEFYPSNTVEIFGLKKETTVAGAVNLTTSSIENLNLRWKKVDVDIPKEWYAFYCDNVVCYLDFPDSANLQAINSEIDSKDTRMKLYIEPNNTTGEGIVIVNVFDPLNNSINDTIVYKIRIE